MMNRLERAIADGRWIETYQRTLRYDKRGADGVHCWALVVLAFGEQLGIALDAHGEYSADDLAAMAGLVDAECRNGPWLPVSKGDERPFDVAVFNGWVRVDGAATWQATHVGLFTGDGRIMHIRDAAGVLVVPLDHQKLRGRYAGAFRHRELAR